MKSLKLLACALFPLALTANVNAKEYSFGMGVGSLYSGLGVNIASHSENSLTYISAGCVSYSSRAGSTCGVGGGWITTNILSVPNNKHGLGAYVGIVGTERESFDNHDAIYGGGLGYHYFFNGIDRAGTNIGLGFMVGDTNDGTEGALVFQLGYQF
ncbi:hypothetical protein [Alteromonas flava]|uniref:hypothetical protein n=1 Tax=Alteromonas flava TaxID=2048003 RepID=UPI000C289064|nr:hypothetical protein [Alteromonas flava]